MQDARSLKAEKRALPPPPQKVKYHWAERNFVTEVLLPSFFMPRVGETQRPLLPTPPQGKIAITWIGHASFLIQTHSSNILIDPNWANWLLAVRRLRRAGVEIDHLPAIDYVLITHAHLDHLHRPTLKKIARKQTALVPQGVGSLLKNLGFLNIVEMRWWEEFERGDLHITFTPAAHWGARLLVDAQRLYGGFHIRCGERSVLDLGDTTYFSGFPEMAERLHPEIVLMPIGAYDTPSTRDNHIDPEQAVQAFRELNGRWLVPMHFGTYRLSYEPMHEPLNRLLHACAREGLLSNLRILFEGVPEVF